MIDLILIGVGMFFIGLISYGIGHGRGYDTCLRDYNIINKLKGGVEKNVEEEKS